MCVIVYKILLVIKDIFININIIKKFINKYIQHKLTNNIKNIHLMLFITSKNSTCSFLYYLYYISDIIFNFLCLSSFSLIYLFVLF